jgi:phenylacetate-CoA ligase
MEHRSSLDGLEWPALPDPTHAQVLALAFQLDHSQWWSPEELLEQQLRQASRVVEHAKRTAPYYSTRLDGVGFGPEPLTLEHFRSLPTLDKATIQRAGPSIFSEAIPPSHGPIVSLSTSGSSGRPTQVRATGLSCLFLMAHTLRDHLWQRREFSGSMLAFRSLSKPSDEGRSPGWVRGMVTGPCRTADITRPVSELLAILIEEDPDYLQVHPYTLGALLERSDEIGAVPGRLKEIRSFGEVLEPSIRRRCLEQWGVPISDTYATEECGPIALQCPESGDLHIQSESTLVEVLDDSGNPCGPGTIGRVFVTPLQNFAMPMIRLELGDLVEVGGPCPCGRGLPTLRRVLGRTRQLVRLPGGDRVHPEFDEEAMRAIADIRQYQLTQVSLEEIEVALVVAGPMDDDRRRRLCDHFDAAFRHPFRYRFDDREEIPRTPRGKFEVFRSLIEPPIATS